MAEYKWKIVEKEETDDEEYQEVVVEEEVTDDEEDKEEVVEEVKEEVELSAEEVAPIKHNPEANATKKETFLYAQKAPKTVKSTIYNKLFK